jgi:hypothetical protein
MEMNGYVGDCLRVFVEVLLVSLTTEADGFQATDWDDLTEF